MNYSQKRLSSLNTAEKIAYPIIAGGSLLLYYFIH